MEHGHNTVCQCNIGGSTSHASAPASSPGNRPHLHAHGSGGQRQAAAQDDGARPAQCAASHSHAGEGHCCQGEHHLREGGGGGHGAWGAMLMARQWASYLALANAATLPLPPGCFLPSCQRKSATNLPYNQPCGKL